MAQLQFNAQQYQPMMPIEPVPEGWYPVVIKESTAKAVTGKPQSGLLSLEMEIIDGPFKGRKLFNNLNLWNESQQASEIAHREMSAICHVTGKFVINDSAEVHNIPFQVKAVVEGNQNRIKGYKDMNGNDPGKAGQGPQNAAPAATSMALPPAAAAPAWGAPPAAAPAAPAGAPAWGAAPAASPAPAWGGGQPAAPAAAPAAAAPAWGGGQPQPAAPAWGR